jgi:uncharacterized membrane protein YeaQ/YmgE (transglycosylase-associated protein family)
MSIIGWMVLGLISGLIASKVVHKEGRGIIPDIILGIGGAIFGGLLFKEFAAESVTRLSLYSMLVAIIGAISVLLVYHAIFDRPRAGT